MEPSPTVSADRVPRFQCQWFQGQVSRGDRDRWPAVERGQPSIRLPPQNELSPARSRQTDRTL